MGLKSVILQNKDKFIEYARNIKPEGRVLITDVEKEIAKSKKRCEDIDNSIFKLFEQNLTQRIPAESYKILLERYKRERAALDAQLITLERRRKSERARNKGKRCRSARRRKRRFKTFVYHYAVRVCRGQRPLRGFELQERK